MRVLASRNFGPLDPRWGTLQLACAITQSEANDMFSDLMKEYGRAGVAMLCGVPGLTVRGWLRKGICTAAARRVVWLTWCSLHDPARMATVWDWVTWGRFVESATLRRRVRTPQEPVDDWSI